LHFSAPLGDLGATFILCSFELVVDFLFVLIKLFSLSVTAEVLRANIDRKSAFLEGVGQF